ncbi:MAG: hypothetical protein Q7K25_09880 [Actinomycetota bacterium]|nr:hypothetical protein [Actinomycetota bacterium]
MDEYQHLQVLTLLRAIAFGIIGVAITVGSFVAGQIAVFLGASNDGARLTTLFTAAFGVAFTAMSLLLTLLPPRAKYAVQTPVNASASVGH